MSFPIGSLVQYTRNHDGTLVQGVVVGMYERPENLPPARFPHLFHQPQLQGEARAYVLDMDPDTFDRIGHPVTIGESRLTLVENKDSPPRGSL